MAQNNQDGSTAATPQGTGLQLQIPGMEQFKNLKFIQSEANPADLIVQLPDGTEVVFPNYIPLAQAGAPPALTLEDGTVIPGVEIVALIEGLDYNKIATAAGTEAGGQGTDGGGAAFTADPSGLLGDDIGHGPYAGGVPDPHEVEFPYGAEGTYGDDPEEIPFEAVDDHVIHNLQDEGEVPSMSVTVDIPDVALRHNDIYPRGEWDLTLVNYPGTGYNGKDIDFPVVTPNPFEDPLVSNSDPAGNDLGMTTFSGTNTTSRFEAGFIAASSDNDGDTVSELLGNYIADENGLSASARTPVKVTRQDWDLASSRLETTAPTDGAKADWDGVSIYLYEGETITIKPSVYKDTSYILAIDAPYIDEGIVPDPLGTGQDLNWDVTNAVPITILGGNISTATGALSTGNPVSYLVTVEGWHYVGTGFATDVGVLEPTDRVEGQPPADGGTPPIDYYTMIEIDGVPYGEFDYTATDYVLSDDAHVTVDAVDTRYWDVSEGIDKGKWVEIDTLEGDSGDDIIISGDNGDILKGYGGLDVLIGRGGNDHLYGGEGRDSWDGRGDLFLFEHAETTVTAMADGHDTIHDFDLSDGDIINLDALFDNLEVKVTDDRSDHVDISGGLLTVTDGSYSPMNDFSITAAGITGFDVDGLIASGNLVVDES